MSISTDPSSTLVRGSCLDREGLAGLDERSIDLVLSDPPYDAHVHRVGRVGARRTDGRKLRETPELGFDSLSKIDMARLAGEYARVAKRWVLIFCSFEMIADWKFYLEEAGLEYLQAGVWHKLKAAPCFQGDRPAQACEAIVVAHQPGRKKWTGGGHHAFWEFPIVQGEGRKHNTEKPVELIRKLLTLFSSRGDLVLDSHAGSGTTGVACRELDRRFVGWEIDEKVWQAACERINQARPDASALALDDIRQKPKAKQIRLLEGEWMRKQK